MHHENLIHEVKLLVCQSGNFTLDQLADVQADTPLFADGIGLDSIDLLELVVNLEKRFGLRIKNDEAGRKTLENIGSIASAIVAHQGLSEPLLAPQGEVSSTMSKSG